MSPFARSSGSPISRFLIPLCLIVSCLLLIGCRGDTRIPTFSVKGKITYRKQPVGEAMLVLHPAVPLPVETPQPVAYSNVQGDFEFTTFKTGDGAPQGEYTITVELREQRQIGEELVRDGRNLLPPQYSSAQKSPLRCTISAGKNELPELELADR